MANNLIRLKRWHQNPEKPSGRQRGFQPEPPFVIPTIQVICHGIS